MLLRLDPKTLELSILVGVYEKYESPEDVQEIYKRLEALREQFNKFKNEVIVPELVALNDAVAKVNKRYMSDEKQVEEPVK